MPKALSEWTKYDLDEFFEKHEMTPQQIIPVPGSGAITMYQMASARGNSEMETYYRQISDEVLSYVVVDLGHRA